MAITVAGVREAFLAAIGKDERLERSPEFMRAMREAWDSDRLKDQFEDQLDPHSPEDAEPDGEWEQS